MLERKTRGYRLAILLVLGLAAITGVHTAFADPAATNTVRVFWLRPSDVPYEQSVVDGIADVMRESQAYYLQELGKTFDLNNPIVEVCDGDHERRWYETESSITTDPYFRPGFNMLAELKRKYSLGEPDSRWVIVGEISAEGDGAGGFGGNGWVCLTKHDVDGAAGINGPMNRWYGGMIHELGHAFGLPDSTYTDGTPMSASFYAYPNCHFTQSQKNGLLNGPFGHLFVDGDPTPDPTPEPTPDPEPEPEPEPDPGPANPDNIAPSATATTSYVSPWETLSAVNDNSHPSNSNDKSSGAYGNWYHPNSIQWVQYDWPQNYSLSSTEIYWFDDNGGVLVPTTAYIEYWNGNGWVNAGDVPLAEDAFNTLALDNIVTSRLRVSMRNTNQSTGILEWRVNGTLVDDGPDPTPEPTPDPEPEPEPEPDPGPADPDNIAPSAAATTSYVSAWETLSAVNDNSHPSNSNDKSSGAYGNWYNPNSIQWVQYDWPQNYSLSSTEIYWFDDNGGVLVPTTAYIEYWDGNNWVNAGDVPLVEDAFNTLALDNIVTNRLRVSMRNTSQSTGILEWRVFGTSAPAPDPEPDPDPEPEPEPAPGSCNRKVTSCASPLVTVTDIDVGIPVMGYGQEWDTDPLPMAIAALPSGGSRLAWLGTDNRVYVAKLDCNDQLVGTPKSFPGIDLQDLYADQNGGVVLLTRNATHGGPDNCGYGTLCGGTSSQCKTMHMVRFDDSGNVVWQQQVTNLSDTLAGYDNGARFVWWYQHHGRLAVDNDGNYAAYFGIAITVNNGSCVDIHQGDRMQVVDSNGSLVFGQPDSFEVGCSHSWATRMVWDPRTNRFVMVCATDNNCRIAQPNPYRTVVSGNCDGTLFGGDLVLSSRPGYWTAWSQGGQVYLEHFTDGASDTTIITGVSSSHPHLVSFGANRMLLAWESGQTMAAQVLDSGTGENVGKAFTINVRDHNYQAFKAYQDGSVAYPAAGNTNTSIRIARVMPCND